MRHLSRHHSFLRHRGRNPRLLIAGIVWPPETFLVRLINGLAEAGFDVTIACASKPDRIWRSHARRHWLAAPNWDGSFAGRLFRLARMAARALVCAPRDLQLFASHLVEESSFARTLQYWNRLLPFAGQRWDVIYFPWIASGLDYRAMFDFGRATIVSCRGSQINVAPHNPWRPELRNGLPGVFGRATSVHCVSETMKLEAMNYGLRPEKAWVIYPAVDPNFFTPGRRQASADGFRVITTGTFAWVKGYEYALLAIRRLIDTGINVQFEIIGQGQERQRVMFSVHDLGLEGHVHLHGRMMPDRVRARLREADAFLLSSLAEGVSNAALEAMSCELPVVTTDCGGMSEAVTDGVEGFVVPVRSPALMADALASLALDASLRRRMGKAGRVRILRQFALTEQIDRFRAMCLSTMKAPL
jgi:colanic acid/amylovoran biosynthesis glycosyltransferase